MDGRTGARALVALLAALLVVPVAAPAPVRADGPLATTVTAETSPAASTYGDAVTLAATVDTDPPGGLIAGTVQFAIDGSDVGGPVDVVAGAASALAPILAAGPHAITAAFVPAEGSGLLASASDPVGHDVEQRLLTPVVTVSSREYNGTTAASISGRGLLGVLGSDDVTLVGGTASFADKHAGDSKDVTVLGLGLGGADAVSYRLPADPTLASADISRRPITVVATSARKSYDGTTSAAGAPTIIGEIAPGDTPAFTQAFATASVGTGKIISPLGVVSDGNGGANYRVTPLDNLAGVIDARQLVVTASGVDKDWDATAVATVELADDRVEGDDVATTYTAATFADAAIGSGKMVAVTGIAISGGDDAANYTLAGTTASTTASILPRSLILSISATSREYDGTTTAVVKATLAGVGALPGILPQADRVNPRVASASFADKHAGSAKLVTATGLEVVGPDRAFYRIVNESATDTADITPRPLAVTATGSNKVYDGTAAATVTLADDRIDGDDVTTSHAGAEFDSPDVGASRPISVTGIAITGGADAANYGPVNGTTTAVASIGELLVTPRVDATDKVYDGSTAAEAACALTGILPADEGAVTCRGTATFDTKDVGEGKTVTMRGISLEGIAAANYGVPATPATTTASITPKALSVTATGVEKVYDGTTTATVNLVTDKVAADDVTAAYAAASFADRHVGDDLPVTVTEITISGADAGNYTLVTTTASTTSRITPRRLTVTATGVEKVYDGTTTATVELSDNRIAGDLLSVRYASAWFATKSAGSSRSISVEGITVTGTDARNYTLSSTTASTTSRILPRPLTVTATGVTRVYDGTIAATVSLSDNRVEGDVLAVLYTSARFATKVAGGARSITVEGISASGADAANYTVGATATATASITPRPLSVTATGVGKVYDGTAAAAVTLTDNRVAGDSLATTYAAASFADPNAGAGKPITVSGISLGGADSANYALQGTTATATATISAAPTTVTLRTGAAQVAVSAPVTLTAEVRWAGGTPPGTVTFREGSTVVGGPVPVVGGTASVTASWAAEGTRSLTASFSPGSANFGASTSPGVTEVVGRSDVVVSLADDHPTWETNVPVTFTATVQPAVPGVTAAPTGSIRLAVDGATVAEAPVVGGKASLRTTLGLGTRSVKAIFAPDTAGAAAFRAGTSPTLARTVIANTVSAAGVGVSSSSVYPVRDSWRDTVAIRGTRNERISVSISIYAPTGSRVRTASIAAGAGPYAYTWNGRGSSGSILAAGRYKVVQVLRDGYRASRSSTSYVTLSRKRMTWYTKVITAAAGPRNFSVPGDPSIQSQFSTTSTRALTLSNPVVGQRKWLAVGYQFRLPAASTYTSLSFQVQGSWSGTTAPKVALVPWSGGSWGAAMYSTTRARVAMDTVATDWDAHTLTRLTGIRSGRYVRAVIDSFDLATGSGYAAGPYRYRITGVRLVVKYGILS